MVRCEHAVIRSADVDDAQALYRLYDPCRPMAGLLDGQQEYPLVALEEIRELLGSKGHQIGLLNAVEDLEGRVQGFCALRGMDAEVGYSLFVLLYLNEDDYALPMTGEVIQYFVGDAFVRLGLNKLLAHCLDREHGYRQALLEQGFTSDGVQRAVLYSGGRWLDLETFSLFRREAGAGQEGDEE